MAEDKILNNMNEVVEFDRSKNQYGLNYDERPKTESGRTIDPQTLMDGAVDYKPKQP
ncbi:hypothetical protein ACIP5Y_25155 [Nocardia sp. NPDC088792]|uniref:hypothetical protein n=1 Tax=Nocardia sp. NPDC088792 TaxID=3364332 RepID=UPI003808B744